jgi:hypothetical protein
MVLHPSVNLNIRLNEFSQSHEENRNALRKLVIDEFVKEKAGHGKADLTSEYKYIVETLQPGESVYLTRPATINKGFDFVIHVENHTFMNNQDNPKHDDIFNDLREKKNSSPTAYAVLLNALTDVFNCKDPNGIYTNYLQELSSLSHGLHPELILKVVKWLFIEQDIRYWNWSGRHMFMGGIRAI